MADADDDLKSVLAAMAKRMDEMAAQLGDVAKASKASAEYAEELKARVDKVEANNKSLKAEKLDAVGEAKAALAKIAELGGDQAIAALLSLKAEAENTPALKRLADGDLAGFLEEATKPQREALQQRIAQAESQLGTLATERDQARQQRDSALLDSIVTREAGRARVQASALQDVALRVKASFKVQGDAVVDDAGKPVDLGAWFAERQGDSAHWWPPSSGGGAGGAGGRILRPTEPHVLTAEQARDPERYQRAHEAATKAGTNVVIVS
jgi:hypothetical protein